jgi:hypothetical protein
VGITNIEIQQRLLPCQVALYGGSEIAPQFLVEVLAKEIDYPRSNTLHRTKGSDEVSELGAEAVAVDSTLRSESRMRMPSARHCPSQIFPVRLLTRARAPCISVLAGVSFVRAAEMIGKEFRNVAHSVTSAKKRAKAQLQAEATHTVAEKTRLL